ncbi:hypothetical protein GCM10028804_42150 [Larkinella terrae]
MTLYLHLNMCNYQLILKFYKNRIHEKKVTQLRSPAAWACYVDHRGSGSKPAGDGQSD